MSEVSPGGDAVLVDLQECRVESNAAMARLVHAAGGLCDERSSVAAVVAGGDVFDASCAATDEVAVALGCSRSAADDMVKTSQFLVAWAPGIDAVFRAGGLDYAKARTIAAVLSDACPETVAAVEGEALAAATRLTPGPLRAALWRAWFAVNPDEAQRVRAGKRVSERKVYVRRGDNGLSWLSACLTDLEGAEAAALIDELATGVCPADPRGLDARRADALLALLHGESGLVCGCGDTECVRARASAPRRRTHLLQILCDIETLLGLAANPAVLPDGSPLDPQVARTLAEDATWQAILVEMRRVAATTSPATEPDSESGSVSAPVPVSEREPESASEPVPALVSGSVPGRCEAPVFLGRGRRRRAGVVPEPGRGPVLPAPMGTGERLAWLERAWAGRPIPVPDGHGGLSVPPAGGLTYRPSAATADLVRALFPTCTFPGCTVASRRCELDHQVPFDHENPCRGGWSIPANLHPLCKRHHQAKTKRFWWCVNLGGGAVLWRSRTGLTRITASVTGGVAGLPGPEPVPARALEEPPMVVTDRLTEDEAVDLLYEPTWWELHMPGAAAPPPQDMELRARWREHRAVTRRRYVLQPPPF